MPRKVRELFADFVKAMNELDFELLAQVVHPEVVLEFPQSGERFTGFAKFRAQLEGYPGGLPRDGGGQSRAQLIGDDERWVITPGYTVLPLAGPERYTTVVEAGYPDGSRWHVVSIIELRDDRIARIASYFAPKFDPPEWRRGIADEPSAQRALG